MGTKGSKNTPITARVNAGLFNQKGGITEPLLNVGPAGVYGNAETRDIPSPSKQKKGYSMAKKKVPSPAKQQVGVNVLESSSTGDKIIKGKKITKKVEGDKPTSIVKPGDPGYAKWLAAVTKDPSIEDRFKDREVETGESEPDTVIPGKTTESNQFTPTLTNDKNDAMSPWRVRQQSRSIKKSGKDVRQSQNKLDKTNRRLAKMDKEDKVVGNRKYDRLMSKFNENTTELEAFKKNMTARTRQTEMSSDPLGKTGTFNSKDRNMTLNDASTTYDGQKAIIEAGGVEPTSDPNMFKQFLGKDFGSGIFKKKAPLKKSYYK